MERMSDPDPGDLVLAAGGDVAATTRLIGRWKGRVYGVFERWEEPSAAAEATVSVFSELLEGAGSYDPAVPFPVWLHRGVYRRFRESAGGNPPAVPLARLKESAAARTAFLRAAVAALPARARAALLFTRVGRLPLETAAAALGVDAAEARRDVVTAMERLARALSPILETAADPSAPASPAEAAP